MVEKAPPKSTQVNGLEQRKGAVRVPPAGVCTCDRPPPHTHATLRILCSQPGRQLSCRLLLGAHAYS
jgi:hypothetical protein